MGYNIEIAGATISDECSDFTSTESKTENQNRKSELLIIQVSSEITNPHTFS